MEHMEHLARISFAVAFALGLAACTQESPPPAPAPGPVSAPTPAPRAKGSVASAPIPPAPSRPAPNVVNVAGVTLGKTLGADNRVNTPAAVFEKDDTFYAVVETIGSGEATIKAKWTYQNGEQTIPINETTHAIQTTGPSARQFSVNNPGGWPPGDYNLEVLLDDRSAGTVRFSVK